MKLHYRKTGLGKPLMILHGLFGSSENWQTLALRLVSHHFEMILPDLRNHGRSPHRSEHTYKAMAEDVIELIETEIGRPVSLIGHSMGGKVAMYAALHFQNWINKLMVIDIAPAAYPVLHNEIIAALKSLPVADLTSRNEADQLIAEKITHPPTRQFLLKALYRDENNQFKWRFNLPVIEHAINRIGEEIRSEKPFDKPVLFIKGEKSEYLTTEHESLIRRLFPQAGILIAPQAGHWVHADNPQWLEEKILSFF
ncbi:MAG: alpha/beta fold hydrolase [Bacteroidia bacterium]|nr:alpha/beta fold hydrolase [Bacteroidia bacterium]MCZ2278297.1 alpha/beta fold hydrolase [Bacteroidia bacterium]